MASLIKQANRIRAAKAFIDEIDAATSYVYLGLSGTSAWADDAIPDTPLDTIDEAETFWNELFGVVQIQSDETKLVVPRKNWTAGNQYNIFDTGSENAYSFPYYALASNNIIYECTAIPSGDQHVYLVETIDNGGSGYSVDDVLTVLSGTFSDQAELTVTSVDGSGIITGVSVSTEGDYSALPSNPVSVSGGGGSSASFTLVWVGEPVANEPTHTNSSQAYADGYTWDVVTNITSFLTLLTDYWMPVNDDYDIQTKLGAIHAMIRIHVPDESSTSDKIGSITYRKVGVLFNPKTSGGGNVDILYGDDTDFDSTFSNQNYGVVLSLDFRTPIVRQASQSETIYSIIKF